MIKRQIKKAVLPVAGLGTRFLPATKVLPKEMLPIFHKPAIQYAVKEALDAGIEEFIFVTGRGKVMIEDHFDVSYELEQHLESKNKTAYIELINKDLPKAGKAFFTRQQHPKGLGHAILCAQALLNNEPFVVILPDEFLESGGECLKQMLQTYYNTPSQNIIAVQQVDMQNISAYGVVDTPNYQSNTSGLYPINSLVEKPDSSKAPSNLAIIGRYIIQPEIFTFLQNSVAGVGNEIQLTDSLNLLVQNQTSSAFLYKGQRFDCGNPLGLLNASIYVALKENPTETQNILNNYINKK